VLKKISIFCLLFFSAGHISAQQLDSLVSTLTTKYPQEKIYLHFDRPYYNPGETIWFKAYISSGNLPSAISKILYAELIDDKGMVLQRRTMPVIQSTAASYFDIPDSLHSTTTGQTIFYVRAYTEWMLNFDSSLLYSKAIPVITPGNTAKILAVEPVYTLHFFPEGGDLVSTLNARIAFKANDQTGVPFAVAGSITDNTGNKITAFSSAHDGMGSFTFTPLPGRKYLALWKDKKGLQHSTDLPEVKKQGVALTVYNTPGELVYTLVRPDSVDNSFTSFYVIATMQEQLVYSARVNMSKKTLIRAPIPTDSFPDGILQLTIFNADQLPVAAHCLYQSW
jgi:hypothetical protein